MQVGEFVGVGIFVTCISSKILSIAGIRITGSDSSSLCHYTFVDN